MKSIYLVKTNGEKMKIKIQVLKMKTFGKIRNLFQKKIKSQRTNIKIKMLKYNNKKYI